MGNTIHLHYPPHYDRQLAPIPAGRVKDWWEDDPRTRGHARHCLPLVMANSLGYYILSPGTFIVRWGGNTQQPAEVEILERSTHCVVDAHAACGSFVVQPVFVPRTEQEGDFVYIKGMPNERSLPYACMEACIESWWSVGDFGLVYILNQAGEFLVRKGQPIAHMLLVRDPHPLVVHHDGLPEGHKLWLERRTRPGYVKDLDYLKGRYPDGRPVPDHVTNWKSTCPRSER